MNLKAYNVEASFPSLDEARRLVREEIRKSKREGVRVLKIIHGYGSSGKGGTLHHGLRKSFALRKKEGVIMASKIVSFFRDSGTIRHDSSTTLSLFGHCFH
ncbi:MAG: Smr/MutS family protein [Limisphaerales bacterium]